MPSPLIKQRFKSPAATLAAEDGKNLSNLEPDEQELYYQKAVQQARERQQRKTSK